MADFHFNISLGKGIEYVARVEANDPVNSAIIAVVIDANGATDDTMKNYDTLADLLAGAPNEVTNTGYARIVRANGTHTITVTDGSDKSEADMADLTWTGVAAGSAWTDLLICYDSDTTAGTDANIIPITCHDFLHTANGGDVTFQLNASGWLRGV